MLAGTMLAVEDGMNKASKGRWEDTMSAEQKVEQSLAAWEGGWEGKGEEQCLPGKESKTMLVGGEGGWGNE